MAARRSSVTSSAATGWSVNERTLLRVRIASMVSIQSSHRREGFADGESCARIASRIEAGRSRPAGGSRWASS